MLPRTSRPSGSGPLRYLPRVLPTFPFFFLAKARDIDDPTTRSSHIFSLRCFSPERVYPCSLSPPLSEDLEVSRLAREAFLPQALSGVIIAPNDSRGCRLFPPAVFFPSLLISLPLPSLSRKSDAYHRCVLPRASALSCFQVSSFLQNPSPQRNSSKKSCMDCFCSCYSCQEWPSSRMIGSYILLRLLCVRLQICSGR